MKRAAGTLGWLVFGFGLTLLLVTLFFALWPRPARAHDFYSSQCCSGTDCQPVPAAAFRATAAGWEVTLTAADHALVKGTLRQLVPFDSPKLQVSPDGSFHACVGATSQVLFCVYVPEFGS